ncbi:MAG: C4-type zinc ribbon domain-containing protein [Ignavibacteria bacterium]|nr:C4-type zinc ribbon domain-containing protein [Ignavibacteria bacterium]
MKTRLKLLWELQKIDNELDKLEELRGELPREIELLQNKLDELQETIKAKKKEKENSLKKREENDDKIAESKANLKKFKAQLLQVKTNREYDALTKEIDYTEELIQKLEQENNSLADLSKKLTQEIEELEPEIKDIQKELEEKREELAEIDKLNDKERKELESKRADVLAKITRADLQLYNRIREAKGRAVVPIKRNACDGCYAIISSQKQLEIRRNDKIYTCESCGRILISAEIENL